MSKTNSHKRAKERVKITKLEEKYIKFLNKYSKVEILIVLTIALSSKLILSKDAKMAVGHMTTSKKALRNAFSLSEGFLAFATKAFIRNSKEEALVDIK